MIGRGRCSQVSGARGVAAREGQGARSQRAWWRSIGGYAPDSAGAEGRSIVDEPGEC